MTWKEMAFIPPALVVGWFLHGFVSGDLLGTIYSLAVIGYFALAVFSVVTCVTTPKPRRNDKGKWWSPATQDEVPGVSVLVWFHGIAVIIALVTLVWFGAAMAFLAGFIRRTAVMV